MKKTILLMLCCCTFFLLSNTVLAEPLLQLDIVGGTYDDGYETIIGTGELVALLNPANGQSGKLDLDPVSDTTFYIVASWNTQIDENFLFDGSPISLLSDAVPDNPQLNHGELGSYGTVIPFTFSASDQTTLYNTQDYPGSFVDDGGTSAYFRTFEVDVTGLGPALLPIHFDLYAYTLNNNGQKVFAPFSHDASSVPEPTTMLLFGCGLFGMAAIGRKKLFK